MDWHQQQCCQQQRGGLESRIRSCGSQSCAAKWTSCDMLGPLGPLEHDARLLRPQAAELGCMGILHDKVSGSSSGSRGNSGVVEISAAKCEPGHQFDVRSGL